MIIMINSYKTYDFYNSVNIFGGANSGDVFVIPESVVFAVFIYSCILWLLKGFKQIEQKHSSR